MFAATVRVLLPAVEHGGQHLLKTLGLQQPVLDMAGNKAVQLLHRDRPAFAAGLALPRLDRAGVVAIAPALTRAERHRTAAVGAEADAGKEGGAAHNARRRDLWIAGTQMRLHGLEGRLVNERRHGDGHDFTDGLQLLGLGALVELVLTDIGAPRQDAMNLPDAPASAVSGEEAVAVEMGRDVFHTHWAGRAVALERKPVDQPDRVGVQRIDFELLLDFRPTLLRRDDAVANGRQGAVPKALTGILLQGAQD